MNATTFTLSEENYEDLMHALLIYECQCLCNDFPTMYNSIRSIRLYLKENHNEKEA